MIYRNSFDRLEQSLHLFIWMTYCRVDVIQRTVFEGFELSEKPLLHLCRNISMGRSLSRGLGKLSAKLAWMTAARAVLALHN